VSDIAFERGVSSRTINNYERAICCAFGIEVVVSFNRRRYANRDKQTNQIIEGYGLELTGLRDWLPIMQAIKQEFVVLQQRKCELKRRLNSVRGRVRQLATALYCQCQRHESVELEQYGRKLEATVRGRVPEQVTVLDLEQIILVAERAQDGLEKLLVMGKTCGTDVEVSDASETTFRPIQLPTKSQSILSDSCSPSVDNATCKPIRVGRMNMPPSGLEAIRADRPEVVYSGISFVGPEEVGADRVLPLMAVRAASPEFLAHLPPSRCQATARDVIEAARCYAGQIGIDGANWNHACQVMGEYPAALCVLVTDNARSRGVRSTGGYFHALAKKAMTRDLAIDRSIIGASRNSSQSGDCYV